MNIIKIFLLSSVLCFILTACGNNEKIVNVTKEGKKYELEDVSFTYPSTFEEVPVVVSSTMYDQTIKFENNGDVISCEIVNIEEENVESELIELFKIDLESMGYSVVSNTKVTLESGDYCYELVAEKSGMKCKYLVIYENNKRYCLTYQAPKAQFDQDIVKMDKYLYTFLVKEDGEF